MKVILAEKPDMGKKIAEALGIKKREKGFIELTNGDIVTWAIGHIVQLKSPDSYPEYKEWKLDSLPVIPNEMRTEVDSNKKEQFNIIKTLLKQSSSCVIATDPGREGEHIARLILNECQYIKPMERLWIQDLTEETIKQGFKSLREAKDYEYLAKAAQLRSYADYWIGYTASRLFTLLAQEKGHRTVLSAGRVQTPTLKMVYDREIEIEQHEQVSFYQLYNEYQHEQGTIRAKWFEILEDGKKNDRQEDKSRLQVISEILSLEGKVIKKHTSTKTKSAPALLDSTSIKTHARKKLKFAIKKTDEVLQKLYDEGYVTYPRTSSHHLSVNAAESLQKHMGALRAVYGERYPDTLRTITDDSFYTDDNKALEHHAIVPTGKDPGSLTGDQLALYEIIFNITLAAFYPKAVDEVIEVVIDNQGHHFEAKQTKVIELGYRSLFQEPQEEDESQVTGLDSIQEGSFLQLQHIEIKEGKQKPPTRYAEDELIKAMSSIGKKEGITILKELGIGTPATRTSIVQELIKREYLASEKNILTITPKGRSFIEMVKDHSIASIDLSASFEERLEHVANGELNYNEAEQQFKSYVRQLVNEKHLFIIEDTTKFQADREVVGLCPACGKNLYEYSTHFGCEGFKEGCKFSLTKDFRGVKLNRISLATLLKGDTLLLKAIKGKEKTYQLILYIENGKVAHRFPTDEELSIGTCYLCKNPIVEFDKYYACKNRTCGLTVYKVILGKPITKTQVKKIISGKVTDLIEGFTKEDKTFDSKLKYDPSKKKIVFTK